MLRASTGANKDKESMGDQRTDEREKKATETRRYQSATTAPRMTLATTTMPPTAEKGDEAVRLRAALAFLVGVAEDAASLLTADGALPEDWVGTAAPGITS